MAALTSISTTSDDAISAVLNACDTYSRYDGLVDVRAVATVTALLGLPPLSRTATASADFENTGYLQAGEVLRLVQEASGGRAPEDGEGDEADEAEAASAEADTAALSRLSATQVAALKSIYGTFHLDERGTVSVKELSAIVQRLYGQMPDSDYAAWSSKLDARAVERRVDYFSFLVLLSDLSGASTGAAAAAASPSSPATAAAPDGERKPHTQFSKAEVMRLHSAFDAFDADDSGALDAAELRQALCTFGLSPSEADVGQLMERFGGEDVALDFGAFVTMLASNKSMFAVWFEGRSKAEQRLVDKLRDDEVLGVKRAFVDYDPGRKNAVAVADLPRLLRLVGYGVAPAALEAAWLDPADAKRGKVDFHAAVTLVAKLKGHVRSEPPGSTGLVLAEAPPASQIPLQAEAYGLSLSQVGALYRLFKDFDTDASGFVDDGEIKSALRQLGWRGGISLSPDDLHDILARIAPGFVSERQRARMDAEWFLKAMGKLAGVKTVGKLGRLAATFREAFEDAMRQSTEYDEAAKIAQDLAQKKAQEQSLEMDRIRRQAGGGDGDGGDAQRDAVVAAVSRPKKLATLQLPFPRAPPVDAVLVAFSDTDGLDKDGREQLIRVMRDALNTTERQRSTALGCVLALERRVRAKEAGVAYVASGGRLTLPVAAPPPAEPSWPPTLSVRKGYA